MKITKYGHACMLVEEGNARLLVDPGTMSTVPAGTKVDAILITHNHFDHMSTELIQKVMADNPDAVVITVAEAAQNLSDAGIGNVILQDGSSYEVNGVAIQRFGTKHALIYGDMPQCENAAFLIGGRLYFPGDAYFEPGVPVELLALPTAGPWMKPAEAIDFARHVKPRVAFPVHDGFIKPESLGVSRRFVAQVLSQDGIEWEEFNDGDTLVFE